MKMMENVPILHLHKAATSCTVSNLILQSLFTHRMRPSGKKKGEIQ
jgi:hypothetical protein